MKKVILSSIRKNWDWWIIAILVGIALFIRTIHFHDWMYPNFDIARDASILRNAHLNGLKELPLLGPKMSGTNHFCIGPLFYYLEYLFVVIFNSHSLITLSLPILLSSIALIPLFYYLIRQIFDKNISLLATSPLVFSYVLTQYSRFIQNPNQIPFWAILIFLAIYKIATTKNRKHAGYWLLVLSFSFGVIGQLHLIPFVGLPVVTLLFWKFFPPKKINWKFWIGSLSIIFILYSPLVIHDIKYQGSNLKNFIASVKTAEKKNTHSSFSKNILKDLKMTGKFTSLFIFSTNSNELKATNSLGISFLIFSLFVLFLKIKDKNNKPTKKELAIAILSIIWLVVFLVMYSQFTYSLNRARYWLVLTPVFFIFLAFLISWLWKIRLFEKHLGKKIAIIFILVILTLNITAIGKWYASLASAKEAWKFRQWSSSTLRQRNLITLGEMLKVVDFIDKKTEDNTSICLAGPSEERKTFIYFLQEKNPQRKITLTKLKANGLIEEYLKNCEVLFYIDDDDDSDERILNNGYSRLKAVSKKKTGKMTTYQFKVSEPSPEDKSN